MSKGKSPSTRKARSTASKANQKNKKGYSLVELMLAISLFVMFAGAVIYLVLGSYGSNRRSESLTQAKTYLEESNEALRTISEEAFNKLAAGTYYLAYDSGNQKWDLTTTPQDPDGDGPFISRTIVVSDVARDANGDINNGNNDPYTRLVRTEIIWATVAGQTTSVSSELYLTAYAGQDWVQTNWQGGSGQALWSDDSKFESTDNNLNYSNNGQVTLASVAAPVNNNIWNFNTATDYNISDVNKIEVIGGVAKLKQQTVTINNNNQYFRNGAGVSPDYWSNSSASKCTWTKTGGGFDDNYYIKIIEPRQKTGILTDYWSEIVNITDTSPTAATLNIKYKIPQYSGTPASVKIYVNIDSAAGVPNIANAVWSRTITGTLTSWQSANINVASKLATAGNYYVKLAIVVDYTGASTDGPFEVNYDNIELVWQKNNYYTDKPYVENKTAWEPTNLGMITGFTETATKDTGTQIYYQMSNDNGATWYYFNTSSKQWETTSLATSSNQASDVNTYIKYFPVGSKKIKFRAYLNSDGTTHQVQLDNIELTYNPDSISMEVGKIVVTNNWQTFNLKQNYDSDGPVIVLTDFEGMNQDSPYSLRVRNVTSSTFEARAEIPADNFAPSNNTISDTANYLAVEEGGWVLNNTSKTRIEAHKYSTNTTGYASNWVADNKTYDLLYTAPPIILAQVMSANDTNWVTTFLCDVGNINSAPSATGFQIGLNAAEVTTSQSRNQTETIGYIVIQNVGNDNISGNNFTTAQPATKITGHDDNCVDLGAYYTNPIVIAHQQDMEENDGSWLALCGSVDNHVRMHLNEDQYTDAEMSNAGSLSGFLVFSDEFNVNGRVSTNSYVTNGYLISSSFQTTGNINLINWDADASCASCQLNFKIKTATTQADLATAAWQDFVNPGLLDFTQNTSKTWIQYRVDLIGNGTNTPTLREVEINYY